jgi:hypothetical protein
MFTFLATITMKFFKVVSLNVVEMNLLMWAPHPRRAAARSNKHVCACINQTRIRAELKVVVRNWPAAKINLEHGRVKIQHSVSRGSAPDLGRCQPEQCAQLKLSAKKTHSALLFYLRLPDGQERD